ncbi:MAG: hypothetical protein CM15mP100_2820 [Alphaproteobacteria bacterium]|nr:MAG: hypothetical protein CM15mP100_2820 [Alphaproteobacteria bacterium]
MTSRAYNYLVAILLLVTGWLVLYIPARWSLIWIWTKFQSR